MNINEVQTYYLVDTNGKFFLTLEQNAIASESDYEKADKFLWSKLVNRVWKKFSKLKVFEEGYDKDYIYEKRENIPIIDSTNKDSPDKFKTYLGDNSNKMPRIGKPQLLLTMRGAIKFNMWKRTEGEKMIASALIELRKN